MVMPRPCESSIGSTSTGPDDFPHPADDLLALPHVSELDVTRFSIGRGRPHR
jgi:hypothetical protein